MVINHTDQQVAVLRVLYSELPINPGESFVQIRQWETVDAANSELVVEYGKLDKDGDLQTQCLVVPFHLTVREALAKVDF